MVKAPDAFRTISEVSEQLDTPAHVLRFWESKFAQVKPVKRAGGRRYYRPEDMALLGGIKVLLHDQGMTIKGAQKLLREQGAKAVAKMMSPPDDFASDAAGVGAVIDAVAEPVLPNDRSADAKFDVGSKPDHVEPFSPPVLPDLPANHPAKPRLLGPISAADTKALQRQAPQITPLYQRLDKLHAAMRAR